MKLQAEMASPVDEGNHNTHGDCMEIIWPRRVQRSYVDVVWWWGEKRRGIEAGSED